MFTLFQQTQPINISCDTNNMPCNNSNEEGFEKKQENRSIGIMVQNILSLEQNYDYFENAIIVAPSQNFKPFWVISKMFIVKNSILQNYFLVNFVVVKESKYHMKQLLNGELLYKSHIFATHIPICLFNSLCCIIILD
jgi:hypothetical protein